MSSSKLTAACLVSLSLSFVTLAPVVAQADEDASTEVATEATPTETRPVRLFAAADYGLIEGNLQAGLRFGWFEGDVGLRGYFDSTESYVGAKLLLMPDEAVVPYFYGQVGNWKNSPGFFGKDDGSTGGALVAGGFGLEFHMGSIASVLLHAGVDHQFGTTEDATKLEAGLGLGVRL
jgi:hypothetical protein